MANMDLKTTLKHYNTHALGVAEITKPLEALGIIGFYYIRLYEDGSFLDLSARPDWSLLYFQKLFAGQYPLSALSDHIYIENGVNLWTLNADNPIWQDGIAHFGYGNGITLCEQRQGFKELYSFYARADNTHINDFYLRHLDFLEKFKKMFVEKGQRLIRQADQYRFILPERYHTPENPTTALPKSLQHIFNQEDQECLETPTPREIECLSLFSKGFSSKEIGGLLGISQRTVENYIANLKSKWHCNKITELLQLALQQNLLG